MDIKAKKKEIEDKFTKIQEQLVAAQQELLKLQGEYRLLETMEKDGEGKTTKDNKKNVSQ